MTSRRAMVLAGAITAVVAVAGCGGGADVQAGSAPAATATVPTLPPVAERQPDLFDPQGCPRVAPDRSECQSTAADADRAAAGATATDWRTLAGFTGSQWLNAPTSGQVVRLADTVAVVTSGRWSARGLARNERADAVAGVTVTAHLLDAAGTEIEVVRGESPVRHVRSGEPVPFELAATTTDVAQVAEVRWEVAAVDGPAPTGDRALELATFFTRDPASGQRLDNYLYHDPPTGPLRFVLAGSAANRGDDPIERPLVVSAWLGPDGRVAAVATTRPVDPGGAPLAALGAGQAGDYVVSLDDPAAAAAAVGTAPMQWGASS